MKQARKILLIFVAALLIVAAGGAVFAVWSGPSLERRLEVILEGKGFNPADVAIDRLDWRGAAVRHVTLGGPEPLALRGIVLSYSPGRLMRGRADSLSIGSMSLDVRWQDGQWTVNGLTPGGGTAGGERFLETLVRRPGLVPFDRLDIREGTASFRQGEMAVTGRGMAADFSLIPDEGWKGEWRAAELEAVLPVAVPPLAARGTAAAGDGRMAVEGTLESADRTWRASFQLVRTPEEYGLRLREAVMPWEKGILSVHDAWIPFGGDAPVALDVQVRQVDLGALMSALTGGRVAAAGRVSGTVPLSVGRGGALSIRRGGLRAEGPGTIAIPPELIPGQGGQTALVRDIVQDLHYSALSLSADPGADGSLRLTMTVEGKNPKVSGGRPVKLNVNLTGNLLEFFQDNFRLMTSPETLLKPGSGLHEKD